MRLLSPWAMFVGLVVSIAGARAQVPQGDAPDRPAEDATSSGLEAESGAMPELETEPEEVTQPEPEPFNIFKETKATGNWFGLRDELRDHGLEVHYFWNQTWFSVMKGGEHTNTLKPAATYDLLMTLDLEKLGVWEDAEALVHARQQWGRGVNPWAGASPGFEVTDDNDGDRGIYVDQLWLRKHFLDHRLSLQLGYLDYQTIIDRNAYANSEDIQFMNTALDNNPHLPTASATGLGAVMYVRPWDWYTLILGALDAERLPLYKPGFSTAFHGRALFLGYMEHNSHTRIPSERGPLDGNYRLGLVYDPVDRPLFVPPTSSPKTQNDNLTFYLSFDQKLYRENELDNQGLGAFFRYSYRKDQVFAFNHFWSLGLSYTGLIPTRDRDVLGFGFAQQIDSDEYRRHRHPDARSESVFELYYAIEIFPWLVLTPDIQYVNNPGGDGGIGHAVAGGIRVRASF